LTLLLSLAALSCAPERELPVGEADIARAREALKPFKARLMGALGKGLEEGPEAAIAVCKMQAPEIASSLSVGGIEMGRTSHRLRNPANAPEPWMEPLLAAYAEGGEERPWRAVRLEGGDFGYVEPIRVGTVCLRCHGGEIAPAIRERLVALYPNDRATGFEQGDFRGLFWVRLAAQEP
jgi:hypothetical protein